MHHIADRVLITKTVETVAWFSTVSEICDALPVRRQTYGYISSLRRYSTTGLSIFDPLVECLGLETSDVKVLVLVLNQEQYH